MRVGIIRCMQTEDFCPGTPIGYPCPFAKRMHDIVLEAAGESIIIFDYTH